MILDTGLNISMRKSLSFDSETYLSIPDVGFLYTLHL